MADQPANLAVTQPQPEPSKLRTYGVPAAIGLGAAWFLGAPLLLGAGVAAGGVWAYRRWKAKRAGVSGATCSKCQHHEE